MFVIRFRECSNVWDEGQGVLQYLGLGSGSAPMFGVRLRDVGQGVLQCFGVKARECTNVWG